jgi:hemolysin D
MPKTAKEEQAPRLYALLEDHSAAGIDILYSQPSRLIRATILVMLLLVVTGLLWSFIGRADVIVSAPGVLAPEEDVRRVYAPIEGELVDIYVAEGQPVSEGDVLARLNARDAIRVASEALEAQLQLTDARSWRSRQRP